MENETEDIIAERVKKLPLEVQKALASDDLRNQIRGIGERHHLHVDQIGTLESEVILVMMGMAGAEDLSNQLVQLCALNKTEADAITAELNEAIFIPIQESMKKFMEVNQATEKSVVMPSSISTPSAMPKPVVPPAPVATPASPAADVMLTQPTVNMPVKKVEPPKAVAPYKADPYREPAE